MKSFRGMRLDGVGSETLAGVIAGSARHGSRTAFRFIASDGSETGRLEYDSLHRRILHTAASLAERYPAGSVILIALPTSPAAVVAVLGAICAGLTPALVPPPGHPRDLRGSGRLARIAAHLRDAALCTNAAGKTALAGVPGAAELAARALLVDDELGCDAGAPPAWRPPDAGPGSTAYLQFTSGSTGAPRGAALTHANVLSNLDLIRRVVAHDFAAPLLSWLPLYHDMGFVVGVLLALRVGATSVLAPAAGFAADPLGWLETIHRLGISGSGAPPFAFEQCLRRAERGDARLAGLDLSSWRTVYTGAEPLAPGLLDAFTARFAPLGFRRDAFFCCYGLAEATLLVAGGRRPAATGDDRVTYPLLPEVPVRIADPETGAVGEAGAEGEILVAGPSVAAGYHGDPAATAATFRADGETRWLRTGDLGRVDDGRLTVTGRLKDVIVVRGANLHAADVEEVVRAAHPLVRHETVAAVALPGTATEALALALELKPPRESSARAQAEVRAAVSEAVATALGVVPDRIVLVRRGSLPRTTSGKLMRAAIRTAILEDSLAELDADPTRRRRAASRSRSSAWRAAFPAPTRPRRSGTTWRPGPT